MGHNADDFEGSAETYNRIRDEARAEAEKLKASHVAYNDTISRLMADNAKLRARVEVLKQANDEMGPKLVAALAEVEKLDEYIRVTETRARDEVNKLRARLALAEAVCEAAEAFELDALKRGKPSESKSVAYAKALAAWRGATG